ncbi:hypothetical protein ACFL3S_02435 [Gemmatimonadota bacterium]
MIRLGLALVAVMAGMAFWGLPPRQFSVTREWAFERTPERDFFFRVQEETFLESWRFQRLQWRDSLTALLRERWEAGESYGVGAPEWAADSISHKLDLGVRLQLEVQGALPPAMPVGVFLVPRGQSAHPAAPDRFGFMWGLREYYVGREGEDPFCYLVNPVAEKGGSGVNYVTQNLVHIPPDSVSNPNTLRLCGFFARFGRPGPGIMAWLRDGAFRMGTGVDRGRFPQRAGPVRRAFGQPVRHTYSQEISPRALACLGGDEEACRAAFLAPVEGFPPWGLARTDLKAYLEDSPADFLSHRWWGGGDLGWFEDFLFQDLEEEFGPERFQAFWNSGTHVEEAFLAAFGQPAGDWMMGWARRQFGKIDRGPVVPANATLFTFLTLGILAGGAVVMGRR